MKKRMISIFLAGIMTLMTACSTQPEEQKNTEHTQSATELEDFDIILDWYPMQSIPFCMLHKKRDIMLRKGLMLRYAFQQIQMMPYP